MVRASGGSSLPFWPNTGSIQVAPMATLRLGPTFKADSIKEGDDVYFECAIQANPNVTRLVWKHEVRPPEFSFNRGDTQLDF